MSCIVLCDWHYEKQDVYKSVPYLMDKGFRVWPSGWFKPTCGGRGGDRLFGCTEEREPVWIYLSTTWGKAQPDELDTFEPTILATRKMLGKP